MKKITVYTSPLPFSNSFHKMEIEGSKNLEELVEVAVCRKFTKSAVIVFLNGNPVEEQHWKLIYPFEKDLVNIKVVPQGGGGKKSPIATLISIAAMVAAPYLAAYATGYAATLGVTSLAGSQAVFLGTKALVSLGGMLIAHALSPPPKQKGSGITNQESESKTLFIEGASNQFTPYGVVPICLGTNRVFPPQAIRPYTEAAGNDNFVRQMFLWGMGKVTIADEKIGETPLFEFNDFTKAHKLDGDLHEGTSLYSNDVYQEDYSVLLSEPDGYTLRTTRPDVDEAVVDITFPSGLADINTESGARLKRRVDLEVQYSPSGLGDWSPYSAAFSAVSGVSLATTSPQPAGGKSLTIETVLGIDYAVGYRRDLIVIDEFSKVISIVKGTASASTAATTPYPDLPINKIKLGWVITRSYYKTGPGAGASGYDIYSYATEKVSSQIGVNIENSSDFTIGQSGTNVTVGSGGLASNRFSFYESSAEAIRRSVSIVFPERGIYDIRIKRVTADATLDSSIDKVYLTSIKSVTHVSPWALENCSGTAIRIKATDQLNGSIDQYNAVCSSIIPDYDISSGTWVERVTSNPASLYLYVLNGVGNAKPLDSSKYILSDLEEWHTHCAEKGYSYNKFIDYEASVDDILADIASAGSASPDIKDGRRTIVVDKVKDDIVAMITPRNSWGFSGKIIPVDLPHALRVQFRNSDKGFARDEITVYLPGYTVANASKFETMDLTSCIYSELAYQHAKRYIFTALLRSEEFTVNQDFENLTCTRGDRVLLAHDIPIIGVGEGRIKSVETDGSSPDEVLRITLDDVITIPTVSTYYARIRLANNEFLYEPLVTSVGETYELEFETPLTGSFPEIGDLVYVVEAGGELDCIVKSVQSGPDLTARLQLTNYAPEIFDEELETPPPFESNITTPLEFIRPTAPVLVSYRSGEESMIVNPDGSYVSRAVITLNNLNDGGIDPQVNVRVSGTDTFLKANLLQASPDKVILTGLEDGKRYDIHIRYRRANGSVLSPALELNNYEFIGASEIPADIESFRGTVLDNYITLDWTASSEIDHAYYTIKHSALYSGTSWNTAQMLVEKVYDSRITLPFLPGTYLIKDVDRLGNESENAVTVVTYNPGQLANVVETLTEHSAFSGTKDNVAVAGSALFLEDPSLGVGYYYFDNSVDLGDLYTSIVKASVVANAVNVNDIFDMTDIFAEDDMFAESNNDIFAMTDVFAETDIFGIDNGLWSVELQYRTKDSSGGSWTAWAAFVAGSYQFYGAEFRLKLTSLSGTISPLVSFLEVSVDMPDRFEKDDNLSVTAAGYTVTYPTAFKNNPSVAILLQDGAVDDKIEFTSKTASGFTFKVYNATTAGYVTRTFDYISAGYGRVT